jgi:hypothetical protein
VVAVLVAVVAALVAAIAIRHAARQVDRARYESLHAWAPRHVQARRPDLIDPDGLDDLRGFRGGGHGA